MSVAFALQEALRPAAAYDMSAGRAGAAAAALIGLAGAVIGGTALRRLTGGDRRHRAVTALAAGVAAVVLAAVVAATADGGVGTGNGLGGAYVAVVVGLISTAIGSLALARARRARSE